MSYTVPWPLRKAGAKSMLNPTITNLPILVRDIPINLALSFVYCPRECRLTGGTFTYVYPPK